jgi:hypothetical protein
MDADNKLRYCSVHKQWYNLDLGCQSCYIEASKLKDSTENNHASLQLAKCPQCLNVSLAWFDQLNKFECMNPKCKANFTKAQYETDVKLWEKALADNPDSKVWFGNSYFDPKTKQWRNG